MFIECGRDHEYSLSEPDSLIKFIQEANQTVTIIVSELLSAEQINLFYEKLKQLSSPLPSIQWLFQTTENRIPYYDLNRRQFLFENELRFQQALDEEVITKPSEKEIRKVKFDLATDSGNVQDVPLQQQQQQQQPEQLKRIRHQKKVIPKPKEIFQIVPEVSLSELNDLVTRKRLLKDEKLIEELQRYYDQAFPNQTKPSLIEIWDNLVGPEAIYIQDKSKTVTGIKKDVMVAILKHHQQFSYGFLWDNPPAVVNDKGEVIQRFERCCHSETQQYVLRFSPDPSASKLNKFTILLAPPFERPSIADFEALVVSDLQDDMRAAWARLNQSLVTTEQACGVFKEILATLRSPQEQQLLQRLESFEAALRKELRLKNSPLTAQHYQHLADMLVHGGVPSLLCFLNSANKIENKSTLCLLLNDASNAEQWSTKSGLARLDKWLEFNKRAIERTWWQALIKQQADAGASLSFNTLFDAFEEFRIQLRPEMVSALPSSFPFRDIRQVLVALERLLYNIQYGPEKSQIDQLNGTDLGPLGAYHARRFDRLTFVLAGNEVNMGATSQFGLMKLANHDHEIFSYAIQDEEMFQACMNMREQHIKFIAKHQPRNIEYLDIKRFYYRYLARPLERDMLIDIDAYHRMAKRIENLSESLTPFDSGPVFVFKPEGEHISLQSLPSLHVSGYVCIRNAAKEPVKLYFIDPNDASTPKLLEVEPLKLSKFLQNLEQASRTVEEVGRGISKPSHELTLEARSIFASITGFMPEENEHRRRLDDITKASLLYICAVAGSGERASNQIVSAADALPEFLKTLQEFAEKMQLNVSSIIEAIHLHGLDQATCPTLNELALLIKSIPVPVFSSFREKESYLQEALHATLTLVHEYGDSAFQVFENYRGRLEQQRQHVNKEAWMTPDYLTFTRKLQSLYQELETSNSPLLATMIKLAPVLSLIQDAMGDGYSARVLVFIKQLQKLNSNLQDMLIEQLMDINLSASERLPTFEELERLCQAMMDEFEGRDIYILRPPERACPIMDCYVWDVQKGQLGFAKFVNDKPKTIALKIQNSQGLNERVSRYVASLQPDAKHIHVNHDDFSFMQSCFSVGQEIYPASYLTMDKPTLKGKVISIIAAATPCRVGRKPMQEAKINLVDVLRRFTAHPQFQDIRGTVGAYINYLPSSLKSEVDKILESLERFRDLLRNDEGVLIEDERETEKKLLALLNIIDSGLSGIHKKVPYLAKGTIEALAIQFNPDKANQIKQFFKHPSLSVFAAPVFEELYSVPMRQQLKSLQLGDESFERFLLSQIQLDPSSLNGKPCSQVASDYSNRFNQLTTFSNSLIRLRNVSPCDFQQCLAKLLHQKLYEKLDFEHCSRLFVVLNQMSKIPVVEQLTWILVELQKNEEQGGLKRLEQVLDGLQSLSEYQDMLDEADLIKYFKESLARNFAYDTPFRFGGEIKIQKMCNGFALNSDEATALRQAISRVYHIILKGSTEREADLFLDTTKAIIKDKLPEALPFLRHLLSSVQYQDDLVTYHDLLAYLPTEPTKLAQWRTIFSAKGTMEHLSLNEMKKVVHGLDRHGAQLGSMCDILFDSEPYPEKSAFIQVLSQSDVQALIAFQRDFDRHPYGLENWERVRQNFGTESVVSVIGGIRGALDNQPLSEREQLDLKRQFDYVNALGTTHTLRPFDEEGEPIVIQTEDEEECTKFLLNQCSRKTLNTLSQRLIEAFRKQEEKNPSPHCLSDRGHRRLTLQLLAVMREQYYRSTGRVPNSTQMLTLIYALDHPERQLFGIQTGEGKSITTALFAGLLAAKGGTVFVPTANRTLVRQDYREKNNDRFFKALGFRSSKIDNISGRDDFHVLGIHYGTDGDLSNFCSNAELKGWNLIIGSDGRVYPWFMVKDEYDYSMDDRTQFKRAIPYDEHQSAESVYGWIYAAANVFVDREDFLRCQGDEAWSIDEDVAQFKAYLEGIADAPRTGSDEKKRHIVFWESRLSGLINDAAAAKRYREGRDFFITNRDEEGRELGFTMAVPFNENGVPQWGGTFPGSRHACLHARLQHDNPGIDYSFSIDSEQFCIASRSSTGFMRLFQIIIGLTGTPGASDELLEQQDKFGMYATSIPPHKDGQRIELAPQFVKGQDLEQAILDAILYHTWYQYPLPMFVIRFLDRVLTVYQVTIRALQGLLGYAPQPEKEPQPILIITKNKIKAEALYGKLVGRLGKDRVQIISGVETNTTREEMLRQAGQNKQVTVGTPLLGRGTDVDPEHEEGLFTIKVDFIRGAKEENFICTSRDERQIMGRSARKGQNGKYMTIYDAEGFSLSGWLFSMFGLSEAERKKRIALKQEHLNQEVAVQRYYLQEMDEIQQVIFNQFDAWMHAFFGEKGENRHHVDSEGDESSPSLENRMLRHRGDLIQVLSDLWQTRLQETTPTDLSNPYACQRRADQTLNTNHLDEALRLFKEDALTVWATFQDTLSEEQKVLEKHLSPKDKMRLELLQQDNIDEALHHRKLNLHRDRTQKMLSSAVKKAHLERRLHLASNEFMAVGHYDGQFLEQSQRHELWLKHAEIYLKQLYSQNPILQGLDNQDKDIATRFRPLIQALRSEACSQVPHAWQTTAFECVKFYGEMHQYLPELDTLEFSSGIDSICKIYIDKAPLELAKNLLLQLNWAKNPASFYGRRIEYTQVMQATRDIMLAARELEKAKKPQTKNQRLQILHQALVKHQQRLSRMWYYFPFGYYFFGYPDTRKVIDQALAQIEVLVQLEHYSAETKYIREEVGQCEAYLEGFWDELEKLEVLGNNSSWEKLKNELRGIYKRNDEFSVVDELLEHLSHVSETFLPKNTSVEHFLSLFRPTSTDAIQRLITNLKGIKQTIQQDHPGYNPLCSELFIRRKESQLKISLKELIEKDAVWNSMRLEVKSGHTGFKPYYEVIITSDHYDDLLPIENFVRDPRREKIKRQLQEITADLEELNKEIEKASLKISRETNIAPAASPQRKGKGWDLLRRQRQAVENSEAAISASTEAAPKRQSLRSYVSSLVGWSRPKSNAAQGDGILTPTISNVESQPGKPAPSFAKVTRAFIGLQSKHQATRAASSMPFFKAPSAQATSLSAEEQLANLQARKENYETKQSVLHERLAQCSPNLMSRRFETLKDFLDFERSLHKQAEALRLVRKPDEEERVSSVCDEEDDVIQPRLESDDTFSDNSTVTIEVILA